MKGSEENFEAMVKCLGDPYFVIQGAILCMVMLDVRAIPPPSTDG